MSLTKVLVAQLVVIVVGVTLISGSYVWVLPQLFGGYRTYSILVVGIVIVAAISAYVSYAAGLSERPAGWLIVVGVSACSAVVTLILALYVIVNVRGT